MNGSDLTLPPVLQYGKRELFQELKKKNLLTWDYNRFMKWVYADPLSEVLSKTPAVKTRKVLLPKEVRITLDSII